MAVPLVVPLPHDPWPLGTGSWNCSPLGSVTTCPASTVPVAGALASLDRQSLRLPVNPYVNAWSVLVSGGLKLALPCTWQPPPEAAAAGEARTPAMSASTASTVNGTNLRIRLSPLKELGFPCRASPCPWTPRRLPTRGESQTSSQGRTPARCYGAAMPRRLSIPVAAAALALGLGACGSDTESLSVPPATAPAQTQTTQTQ